MGPPLVPLTTLTRRVSVTVLSHVTNPCSVWPEPPRVCLAPCLCLYTKGLYSAEVNLLNNNIVIFINVVNPSHECSVPCRKSFQEVSLTQCCVIGTVYTLPTAGDTSSILHSCHSSCEEHPPVSSYGFAPLCVLLQLFCSMCLTKEQSSNHGINFPSHVIECLNGNSSSGTIGV